MCSGCFSLDTEPSPKSHCHLFGSPVERSVKLTVSGEVPEVGNPLNCASGGKPGGVTVI